MNRLESLKARLATASPDEAKTINALIRELEADPETAPGRASNPTPTDPRLRFLNSEQAKFWGPIILGKAKAYAQPEDPVDPLEDPCKRRR